MAIDLLLTPEPPVTPRKLARTVISIRIVVTSVALTITTSAMLGVGAVAERNARRALTAEVQARLLLEGRNLARSAAPVLLGEFPELTLHPLVKELAVEHGEIALAVVVDHRGLIQGHPDARELGHPFAPPPGLKSLAPQTPLHDEETLASNDNVMLVSVPIVQTRGRELGTVWVGVYRSYVDGLLEHARQQVILILSIALALGMLATFAIMTWLLRPVDALREGLERIGRGDLETPLAVRDHTELGMLAAAVNTMAGELKEAQTAMVEKERLAHELDLARDIQRSILPTQEIRINDYLVDGTQEPAQEVGGDYYDFFPLEGGKVGVAIADVSGKGLAGCVVMSMLSALLRAFKDTHTSPSMLLSELDMKLTTTLRPGTFVTMFYGVLDPSRSTLTYASAAHCPTLVYRSSTGTIEVERSTGIPLGAIRGGKIRATLQDHVVTIAPGDMVLQYTDGVNETFDPARQHQYGFERLQALVASKAGEGWHSVLLGLRQELSSFRGRTAREDDETLLVIARDGKVAAGTGSHGPAEVKAHPAPRQSKPLEMPATSEGCLALPANLEELPRIRDWLFSCPGIDRLDESEFEVLTSALYEACANIVEHGYNCDRSRLIHLSKLPDGDGPRDGGSNHLEFLIRDQGRAFSADNWMQSDFTSSDVRRRGRGFGLDIIHRAMVHVEYRPSTSDGNLTLLVFDPAKHAKERKLRYA
jgi:serine phosphatase RsbU (regulator of sigma subunit)/anti-sigma regulatory factor (Ser/Thr protein kinase)